MRTKTRKISKIDNVYANQNGFTLIDMAIATMLIGLLITPILYALNEYRRERVVTVTEENIEAVNRAIEVFYLENNFFPCPADPTLSRSDANHGTAELSAGPNNCARQEGSVPHEALGISIERAYDGWGNKLLYAVTDAMTVAGFPATTAGALQIQDIHILEHPTTCMPVCANTITPFPAGAANTCAGIGTYPASPIRTTNNVTYTLLSHGADAVGAYNADGTLLTACVIGATTDSENCNNDGIYASDANSCLFEDTTTASRYDDYILLSASSLTADGAADTSGLPSRLFEDQIPGSIGGTSSFTGINNNNPQYELDVIGDIIATDSNATKGDGGDGAARSDRYCTSDGSSCFESELIGGAHPDMQCSSDTGMVGIGYSHAQCARQFSAAAAGNNCPPGQYIISLSSSGGVVCSP